MERRRAVERGFREAAERFGYREVMTPAFEHLELFTGKSGEGVVKQLYEFQDKSGRRLTLRPELTAPVLRFYVNELSASPKPLKLYYLGNCFRYEEPQSGRYREFWQFGTELIGPDTPEAAAESVALAHACLAGAGLANLDLRVGHIGVLRGLIAAMPMADAGKAELHRRVDKREPLEDWLRGQGVPEPQAEAFARIAGARGGPEVVEDALAALRDDAAREALEALRATHGFLDALGVRGAQLDLGVVRGLDYYTGVVFEFHSPDLGAESQVCGGGVYSLAEVFGGEPVGTVGFAIGLDRVLLALERAGQAPPRAGQLAAYIVPIGEPARAKALALAQQLRGAGLKVDVDLMRRGPSKCLDYANSVGARRVVLLGSKELERGVATVKDMQSGEQREVPLGSLASSLEG
jgi:histidyl-tRNA synthetase